MWHTIKTFLIILTKQPNFAIEFKSGKARLLSGKVTPFMLKECEDIMRDMGKETGLIMGLNKSRGLVLEFSKEFSEFSQQRFRNIWVNAK